MWTVCAAVPFVRITHKAVAREGPFHQLDRGVPAKEMPLSLFRTRGRQIEGNRRLCIKEGLTLMLDETKSGHVLLHESILRIIR